MLSMTLLLSVYWSLLVIPIKIQWVESGSETNHSFLVQDHSDPVLLNLDLDPEIFLKGYNLAVVSNPLHAPGGSTIHS